MTNDSLCTEEDGHIPFCAQAAIVITMPQCGVGDINQVDIRGVNIAPDNMRKLLERALKRWDTHLESK